MWRFSMLLVSLISTVTLVWLSLVLLKATWLDYLNKHKIKKKQHKLSTTADLLRSDALDNSIHYPLHHVLLVDSPTSVINIQLIILQ